MASAIAAALVFPVNLAVERLQLQPGSQAESLEQRYAMRQNCKGPDGDLGPCVVVTETGENLGL